MPSTEDSRDEHADVQLRMGRSVELKLNVDLSSRGLWSVPALVVGILVSSALIVWVTGRASKG